MSNLSTVTDNMLPVSSETFVDNLAAGISAGADTVPLLSLAEYSDGDSVVLTVDPGTADQATFIGVVDGNEVINVEWTEGNVGASHAAGATVIDYDSSTHYNVVTKLLRMFANQNGTLKTTAVQAALNITSAVPADWTPLANTPSVTSNNGQREHVLTYTGIDYTDRLQPGAKLRIPRTGTIPTQSASFNGTNQYMVKTAPSGLTFTDDFTCEAWVYVENYTGSIQHILGRQNGSTEGFQLSINETGQVRILGRRIASNNRRCESYQSVPLNRWVHIAATLDMSGNTGAVYIDGVSVPTFMTTAGTATALVQGTTAFSVGASNTAIEFFAGKISNARVWSTIRTATQIRDNMNKEIPAEAGLVVNLKFNGDLVDSSSSGNDVTGSGGAAATYADNPFKAVEYAIVTKVEKPGADTLVTIFSGQNSIPQELLGATSYSTARAPLGFPAQRGKWSVQTWVGSNLLSGLAVATWTPVGAALTVPIGSWRLGYTATVYATRSGSGTSNVYLGLSTTTNSSTDRDLTGGMIVNTTGSPNYTFQLENVINVASFKDLNQAVPYYLLIKMASGGTGGFAGEDGLTIITAECAYI